MDFYEYKHRALASNSLIPADITQRWHSRIVANGWNELGRDGAANYLAKYGRGISAVKAMHLGRCAERAGFPAVANRFFEEAFFLETGKRFEATDDSTSGVVTSGAIGIGRAPIAQPFHQSPQLITVIDEAMADRLINDPAWGLQQKIDGERCLIQSTVGGCEAGNKRGLVRQVPMDLNSHLSFGCPALLDGELVTSNGLGYYIFDLLGAFGKAFLKLPFSERYEKLVEFHQSLAPASRKLIHLVPLYTTTQEKRDAVERLRNAGAEGFVLKRLDAAYSEGESHGDQFKFQFRATSAFLIGDASNGRRSVQIYAFNPDGSRRDFGRVTIPANEPIPAAGSIAEIQYLYCHKGSSGKLAQPVWKGLRFDCDQSDCLSEKLRVAP